MFNLFPRDVNRDRETLVRDLAKRTAQAVMQRLGVDTDIMSVAELRGYVRARAMSVVRAQIRQWIGGGGLQATRSDELAATILERTVHLVLQDRLAQPVATIPAPHVRLRIAA